MIKLLAVAIIVYVGCCYDFYLVRHGARAPLKEGNSKSTHKVFGVGKEQLTMPGKSEAYYFGKQLRLIYKSLKDEELMVYSTPFSRTRMTAEYFLKGWSYQHPYIPSMKDDIVTFSANPKHVPPIVLSFKP